MNELRQYQLERGCLQKEIANKLGLSESKVSRLMRVNESLKTILTYDEYKRLVQLLE